MSDVNFLTWNVRDANIKDEKISAADRTQQFKLKDQLYTDLLAELNQRETHVLILQECFRESAVQALVGYREVQDLGGAAKHGLRVLLREDARFRTSYVERFATHRALCVQIERSNDVHFNLIGVHLFSKKGRTPATQDDANFGFVGLLTGYEEDFAKNKNSVVVGDLNYSPFDDFVIGPMRLNAVGDKDLITRLGTRQYNRQPREFFYNPMWNLLGDAGGPAPNGIQRPRRGGSFFWEPKGAEHHYWNLVDGVLLRPSLMNNLAIGSLQVLETINGQPLLAPDPKKGWVQNGYSDHLPVVFTLTF